MSDAIRSASAMVKKAQNAGRELSDAVETLRSRVRTLKAERDRIRALSPPMDIAIGRIRQWAGEMRDVALSGSNGFIPTPSHFCDREWSPSYHINVEQTFNAYLMPLFLEAFERATREHYETIEWISDDERETSLIQLDRDLLDVEMAEESVIRAAEASGFPIVRRGNADPRAVLAHDKALP
ncbi:hypothetical protein IGS74_18875 [Aureimonas sp. OT7]|uniref:hypothetical protein n=1 Tax=Aureimonas sp. OT7 TaxID=2816454 RepID=UPI001785A1F2|nr:hypothetical protein [Aureimonas sp. OT7]QOG06546.1 hypothetical protein IGS74_18875 [Aureimonas sp. OT7]